METNNQEKKDDIVMEEQENENQNNSENIEENNEDQKEENDNITEDINVLKEKIKKQDNQIKDYIDRLKRNMAEFDNYRKRTDKEKKQMYEIGAKEILEKILPVVDNFERALNSIVEQEKDNNFVQGVEMIYKQFYNTLTELGVNPIEAVGNTFNPNYHNAVMHEENDEFGENTVSEEFQKGYLYKDSVLRPSMVKVVN